MYDSEFFFHLDFFETKVIYYVLLCINTTLLRKIDVIFKRTFGTAETVCHLFYEMPMDTCNTRVSQVRYRLFGGWGGRWRKRFGYEPLVSTEARAVLYIGFQLYPSIRWSFYEGSDGDNSDLILCRQTESPKFSRKKVGQVFTTNRHSGQRRWGSWISLKEQWYNGL